MIKVVAVFLVFAVIGGVLYWIFSPLSLAIGSAIPQLASWISTAQQHIQNITDTVTKNWQVVTATAGSVTVVGGWIANKLYKHNLQKQELEQTAKLNEFQSTIFQKQGEVLGLQNQLKNAQDKVKTLEDNASNIAELTKQLADKQREVDKAIAERNQALKFKPILEKIEEAQKVH